HPPEPAGRRCRAALHRRPEEADLRHGASGSAGGHGGHRLQAVSRRPRLAVTLGDVRGIGPEIVGKALGEARVRAAADYVVVGPRGGGVEVDEATGAWTGARDAAMGGRLAGRAIER